MRSKILLLMLLSVLFSQPEHASATLISVTDAPLAYDPTSGLYWYTNLPQLVGTYQVQAELISQIVLPGYTNFHFATDQELTSLVSAASHASDMLTIIPLMTPWTIDNNSKYYWWGGRGGDIRSADENGTVRPFLEIGVDPVSDTVITATRGVYDDSTALAMLDIKASAWVVGDAEPAPVPEPTSLALLLFGFPGIMYLMRKSRRGKC